MAAQPKNKITRVERGKRRHGNTPKLLKDTKVSRVPLHKQGFFGKIMEMVGQGSTNVKGAKAAAVASDDSAKNDKKTKATPATIGTLAPVNARAAIPGKVAPTKKVRQAQHKGS